MKLKDSFKAADLAVRYIRVNAYKTTTPHFDLYVKFRNEEAILRYILTPRPVQVKHNRKRINCLFKIFGSTPAAYLPDSHDKTEN